MYSYNNYGLFLQKIQDHKHLYITKIENLNNQIFKLSNEYSTLKKNNDLLLQFIKNKQLNIECENFITAQMKQSAELDEILFNLTRKK